MKTKPPAKPSRAPAPKVSPVPTEEKKKQYRDKRASLVRAQKDAKELHEEIVKLQTEHQKAHDAEADPLNEEVKELGKQLQAIQAKHQKAFADESKELMADMKSLNAKVERLTKECARLADAVIEFDGEEPAAE